MCILVMWRSDGGPSQRDLTQLRLSLVQARDPSLDLAGEAGELLSEAYGGRVLEVGPAHLDHVIELIRLVGQRTLQVVQGRQERL